MTTKHEITPDELEAAMEAYDEEWGHESGIEAAITAFLEHRAKKGQEHA